MEIKELQIETAEKWEASKIKTLHNYEEFRNELKLYHQVDDIFTNPKIKIRQDQNKYLFNINGENLFAVDTPRLEERLNIFYDEKKEREQRKTVEEVYIRVEWLEITYLKTNTQDQLNNLQYEINKTNNKIEHATDIETIKYKVERYIAFFEQEKDLTNESISRFRGTKYDRIDRWLWKINKTEVKRRLKQLKKIKKQIERLEKNKGKTYTINRKDADGDVDIKEVQMNDINAFDEETTLRQLNQKIEKLGEEAPDFIKTRNEIILENADTTPYYELTLNNVRDAAKLKIIIQRINDDYMLLNKMSLSDDKRQALQQDLIKLQEYLQNYANNPNEPLTPFVPESWDAFEKFCAIDPEIKRFAKLNKTAGKPSDGKEEDTWWKNRTTNIINTNKNNPETNNNTSNTSTNTNTGKDFWDRNYIETFKEWGVSGMLRKTLNMFPNMSAESKNTWTSLLVVGWVGFWVWKMARRLFSGKRSKNQTKEKTPFRKRLLIAWWVTLGFNAFGTNPFKFAEQFIGWWLDPKTLKLQWPRAKTSVENPENELTVIELNEIFGPLPISKIKEFVDPKTFKLTEAGHNGLLLNFQWTDAVNKAKRDLIERMRVNKDKDILKTSFATIGITPSNINNLDEDKTVKEYTDEVWYTIEWDIRDGEDDAKIDITNQVKDFDLPAKQKANLIKYGNILYDEKPWSSTEKVEFIEKNTKIYLKTYGERTTIDPEKLTIPKYTKNSSAPIVFDGYKELMKAANLTNYLKSIFRGKATWTQFEPFQTAGLRGKLTWDRWDIMFNNGTSSFNPTHTEAIDAGRFGTLGKISPTLEENKEAYINYLNDLNIWNEVRSAEDKPN